MFWTTASYLTLPLGEIVLGMSFFGEVDQKESPFRILSKGVLFGGIFLTVILLRNILLLGAPTCRLFLFTSYDAVGVISVGDFVTRISVFIGVEQTLTGVIKLSSFGLFGHAGRFKDPRPEKISAARRALLRFDGSTQSDLCTATFLTEINFEKYVSLIAIPFQLIFPVVTLIVGRIRQGGRKKDAAKKAAPVKEAAPAPKEPAL
jgi:spore germination protein KB